MGLSDGWDAGKTLIEASNGANPIPGVRYSHEEIGLMVNSLFKEGKTQYLQPEVERILASRLGDRYEIQPVYRDRWRPSDVLAMYIIGAAKAGYYRLQMGFFSSSKTLITPPSDPSIIQKLEIIVAQQRKSHDKLDEEFVRLVTQVKACRAQGREDATKANFPLAEALVQRIMILPVNEKLEVARRAEKEFEDDTRMPMVLRFIADVEKNGIGYSTLAGNTLLLGLLGLTLSFLGRASQQEVLSKASAFLRLYFAGIA